MGGTNQTSKGATFGLKLSVEFREKSECFGVKTIFSLAFYCDQSNIGDSC